MVIQWHSFPAEQPTLWQPVAFELIFGPVCVGFYAGNHCFWEETSPGIYLAHFAVYRWVGLENQKEE